MPVLSKRAKVPTEKQLWASVRKRFNTGFERAYRIEAVNTPGFPDVVWVPYLRAPVFIELKAGPMKFRTAQIRFINEMHRNGTHVWVLWQPKVGQEPIVCRGEWLLHQGTDRLRGGEPLPDWMARMKGY